MIQHDDNGDPYLFNPGDMGTFIHHKTGSFNARTGEEIVGRSAISGTAKFTGGGSADGSPTLARNHPPISAEDIPATHRWPSSLGSDPR